MKINNIINISVRLSLILSSQGIKTLDEAAKITFEDWGLFRNAGKKSWNELQCILEEYKIGCCQEEKKKSIYCFRPKNLDELLNTLAEREKKVLIYRFGFFGEESKTLKAIGEIIGVNAERIRQIQAKALRKLRHPTRRIFFAFLPDNLMEAVFGTDDFQEVIDILNRDAVDLTDVLHHIDERCRKVDHYIETMNNNYANFIDVLQGSNLYKYLKDINKMATKLESQCVNTQATLQIAQKFLGTNTGINLQEIENLMIKLGEHLFRMESVEKMLKDTILDKEIITHRGKQ